MRSPDDARRWLGEQSGRQLSDAQRQLRITAAQLAAWDAYAASVGALVGDLSRFDAEPLSETSVQRVDRRVDRARNRYTALENVADAMRGLYATLSDEQRATADRILVGTLPSIYEGNPFGGADAGSPRQPMNTSTQRRPGRGEPPPR